MIQEFIKNSAGRWASDLPNSVSQQGPISKQLFLPTSHPYSSVDYQESEPVSNSQHSLPGSHSIPPRRLPGESATTVSTLHAPSLKEKALSKVSPPGKMYSSSQQEDNSPFLHSTSSKAPSSAHARCPCPLLKPEQGHNKFPSQINQTPSK